MLRRIQSGLRNINMKSKVTWLVLTFLVGFLSFGIFTHTTIQDIRIGGPRYIQVVADKVLLADGMPPFLYVVESYLSTHLMQDTADEASRTEAIRRYKSYKKSYEKSMANWSGKLADGAIKNILTTDAKKSADAIFEVTDNELLPAMPRNDEEAKEAISTKLEKHFGLDEIQGRHHSLFVEGRDRSSTEYQGFWNKLRLGEHHAGEFKRIGKDGKEFWIQASYNPILDLNGQPYKVVKFAIETTVAVKAREDLKVKVSQIPSVVDAAANGDLTPPLNISGTDPIGLLAARLNSFFDNLRGSMSLIADNATALAVASEELSAVSSQMSGNADETSKQANIVSAASEEVSATVRTVATDVDDMNAAIREIAKNASDASRVSQ
jgi:PAS domain S-box-containing protein